MSSTLSEFVKNCSQKICKEVFDNRSSSNNKNENCCGSVPANTQRKFSTIWNLTNFGKITGSPASSSTTNQTTATGTTKDVRSLSTTSYSLAANAAAANTANTAAAAAATTSQKPNQSFVINMTSSVSAPSFQQQSAKEQEADYDPYKNRKVNHPTSFNDTLLHLLKGSLGTGILFMPNAFTHSGYVLGIFGTLIIGLICTYCIHMLVSAQYELCRRKRIPSLSYTGTAEASFKQGPILFQALAPYTVHIINVFLLMYQLGTCCVYVAFIAENVKKVGDLYFPDYKLQVYMCLFLVPLLLLSCVKNLKKLTPISSFANFLTIISYTMIVYYLFCENPTLENREAISSKIETYPLFFGTVLFALEAIGMMLPLENEMKHPKKFSSRFGVLNIGMISIIFMYIGMGMLGYMAYGDKVNDSITMSLDISKSNIGGQIVLLLLALSIFFTYAIQFYVAIKIVWDEYIGPKFDKNPQQYLYQYVVRCLLVLLTFSIAAACPKIELFVSLVGAFCLSALGIGIPALVELSAYWYQRVGLDFGLMLAKNLFLVMFCIIGLLTGTYVSVEKIAHAFFKNQQNP